MINDSQSEVNKGGRPRSQPENAVCHPERRAYSRGVCRKCYDAKRWSGKVPRSAATREVMDELTGKIPRARRRPTESSQYIRTNRPAVAKYVAEVVVKNLMDIGKAVREMKPELSEGKVAETAQRIEQDPYVKQAIERTLQKRGLDEQSKEHFVDLLWRYAESEDPSDERRQLQAMRILGKAFVSEKVEVSKPTPLRINGFTDGIRGMFGDAADEVLGKEEEEEIN